MSLKNVKELEKSQVELEIEISAEDLENAIVKVFKKSSKNIQVPGFRKGKAPRKMVEKLYGEGVFFEDALNELYPAAVEDALKESKIEAVDNGKADVEKISKEEGVLIKVIFTVKPEIKLGEYKGVKAQKVIYKTDAKEVNAEIERIRKQNARLVTATGKAKKGDIVNINFEGFVDSVPFEGGKGENFDLTLGSGQFIPGFEEQLVGCAAEDEKDVVVTFPEEYGEKSLAGKEATFKVKVLEVKKEELPALDDEFVKDVSEFDTLAEYKKSIKKQIQESKESRAQGDLENAIIDEVLAGVTCVVPDAMIQNQVNQFISEYEQKLSTQGMDFSTYLQYTGSNIEEFRKSFAPEAEKRVKIRLALEEIVNIEKIVISDEEIEEEYNHIATEYKMEVEKVKGFIPSEDIAKDIAVTKAIELIKNNADVEEVPFETLKAEIDKKEAEIKEEKKAATKKTKKAEDEEK